LVRKYSERRGVLSTTKNRGSLGFHSVFSVSQDSVYVREPQTHVGLISVTLMTNCAMVN